jgi:hypothetical protein
MQISSYTLSVYSSDWAASPSPLRGKGRRRSSPLARPSTPLAVRSLSLGAASGYVSCVTVAASAKEDADRRLSSVRRPLRKSRRRSSARPVRRTKPCFRSSIGFGSPSHRFIFVHTHARCLRSVPFGATEEPVVPCSFWRFTQK